MKSVKKILGFFVLIMVAILCVPNSVNAAEMSDEFRSLLNEEGKYVINMYKPTDPLDLDLYFDTNYYYNKEKNPLGICFRNLSEDMTNFDLIINCDEDNAEKHNVPIVWNYDQIEYEKVQNYLNSTLKDKAMFKVQDMEIVSYILGTMGANADVLALYSGELKRLVDYNNITLYADSRAGGYDPFEIGNFGMAQFKVNDITYAVRHQLGAHGDLILYVPTDTPDDNEEIVKILNERAAKYVEGTDKFVEFSYVSTAREYWEQFMYDYYLQYEENASLTFEQYKETLKDEEFESMSNGIAENELVFAMAYGDDHMGGDQMFVVRKDSSKMVEPYVKTKDLKTDIMISTNENIPVDTLIQAKKLTSGSEYERILEILNLTDNVTFDLKLYSDSTEKYITKLNDGNFEVKMPIPENFKGKKLIVYYVKDNGEKEPYTVDTTSEPGYAIFTTNHFSIYTLGYTETAPTKVKVTFDANGGKFETENTYTINDWTADMYDSLIKPTRDGYKFKGYFTEKTGGTKFEMILNEAGIENNSTFYARWEENSAGGASIAEPDIENPKTSDEIGTSLFIGTISLICLVGASIYLKKRNKVRA